MSQDALQWLSEIKALQQQLTQLQEDRDATQASAVRWQKLYEVEAQQRRSEAQRSQEQLALLQAEITQLKTWMALPAEQAQAEIARRISALGDVEDQATLREQLTAALSEQLRLRQAVDHLQQTLKAEQDAHEQTRQSLTTALGDAIDLLNRQRQSALPDGVDPETPKGTPA